MPTPDSAAENRATTKKARGRPKTAPTKATKTKASGRRTSGRLIAKAKAETPAPTKVKRKALTDKTNHQHASDTEEVDEFEQEEDTTMRDGLDATIVAVEESKVKVKATKKQAATGRSKLVKKTLADTNSVASDVVPNARATKKKGPAKKAAPAEKSPEKVILESQAPEMEVDDIRGDEEVEPVVSKPVRNTARPRDRSRLRQPSVQRHRAGSASDTERSDPALRRKLGEVTKKYENLNVKYQDLREIGLKEAERNFERYRKQSEEKTTGKSFYFTLKIFTHCLKLPRN